MGAEVSAKKYLHCKAGEIFGLQISIYMSKLDCKVVRTLLRREILRYIVSILAVSESSTLDGQALGMELIDNTVAKFPNLEEREIVSPFINPTGALGDCRGTTRGTRGTSSTECLG